MNDLLQDSHRIRLQYQSNKQQQQQQQGNDMKKQLERSFLDNLFLITSLFKDESIPYECKEKSAEFLKCEVEYLPGTNTLIKEINERLNQANKIHDTKMSLFNEITTV